MTTSTAELGPLEEAAALTTLIEKLRAELADLVDRRTRKVNEARGTVARDVVARRVRLSPGRISQIAPSRRGRQVGTRNCQESVACAQTATPQTLQLTTEEAS